jgi:hypothetical protein
MKITVQITIKSDEAASEVVQDVACLERGSLQPEMLGLSLAAARSILAGLEGWFARSGRVARSGRAAGHWPGRLCCNFWRE